GLGRGGGVAHEGGAVVGRRDEAGGEGAGGGVEGHQLRPGDEAARCLDVEEVPAHVEAVAGQGQGLHAVVGRRRLEGRVEEPGLEVDGGQVAHLLAAHLAEDATDDEPVVGGVDGQGVDDVVAGGVVAGGGVGVEDRTGDRGAGGRVEDGEDGLRRAGRVPVGIDDVGEDAAEVDPAVPLGQGLDL